MKTSSDSKASNRSTQEAKPSAQSMRPIQFRVPEDVFEAFSEQAGHEFGFSKGAKSQLFLKLWAEYRTKKT